MVKPFISPRVCGKVKEKKKRPDQFCELKNILRPTTTTRRKKKKKDRKDYSNELNRDVIGIVGKQNRIS